LFYNYLSHMSQHNVGQIKANKDKY
jgi:hypothetical protein